MGKEVRNILWRLQRRISLETYTFLHKLYCILCKTILIVPDKHLCYILSDQNSHAESNYLKKKKQKREVAFSFCASLILSENTPF